MSLDELKRYFNDYGEAASYVGKVWLLHDGDDQSCYCKAISVNNVNGCVDLITITLDNYGNITIASDFKHLCWVEIIDSNKEQQPYDKWQQLVAEINEKLLH